MKMIDNYRDLPIGMYLDICEIDRREDLEEINKQVCIISILTGMAEEDILNLPLDEYRELAAKTRYLSHPYDGEVLTAKNYIVGKWNHLLDALRYAVWTKFAENSGHGEYCVSFRRR